MDAKTARRALIRASAGFMLIGAGLDVRSQGLVEEPPEVLTDIPQVLSSGPSSYVPEVVVDVAPAAEPSALAAETRPPLAVAQPPAREILLVGPQPVVVRASTGSLRGKASWYCNYDDPKYQHSVCHHSYPDNSGSDMYAAACGKLRRAIGSDWRGKYVTVAGNGRTIMVRLIDWCGSEDKTIDLYRDAMDKLRGGGVVDVKVAWQ